MNKRDKKHYIIGLLIITLVGVVLVEWISPSIWYQKITKQVIELEAEYPGKDQFEQEKNALLEVAKQCGFTNDAKVMLSGMIPDLNVQLNKEGQSLHRFQETQMLSVYDRDKMYSVQFTDKYRVFISRWKEKEGVQYYNFLEYVNSLDLYDSKVVNQLDYPYYNVSYMPYKKFDSVFKDREAKLYLYEKGEYKEIKEVPIGAYGYFSYVGSKSENSYSREKGTYGYLFVKR